jgi:hypothetical protein
MESLGKVHKLIHTLNHYLKLNTLASKLGNHDLSPLILRASCISLGMIVTLLAWIAHKFVSSNKPIMYASAASCRANTAEDWNLRSFLYSDAISLTSL